MDRLNYTAKRAKGQHLNYEERIKIEALNKIGMKSEKIAAEIGCSGRTIRLRGNSEGCHAQNRQRLQIG